MGIFAFHVSLRTIITRRGWCAIPMACMDTRQRPPRGGGRSSRRPRAANTGKVARVQHKADTRMAYATGVSLHTAQADAPALSLHFFNSLGKIRRFQTLSPHRLHFVPSLWLSSLLRPSFGPSSSPKHGLHSTKAYLETQTYHP